MTFFDSKPSTYKKPLILNGRIVKRFYGCDISYGDYNYGGLKIGVVSSNTVVNSKTSSKIRYLCNTISVDFGKEIGVQTRIGYFVFRDIDTGTSNYKSQTVLDIYSDSSKSNILVTGANVYSVETSDNAITCKIKVIKLNDTAYALLYNRRYTVESGDYYYNKASNSQLKVVYLKDGLPVVSAATSLGNAWTESASTSYSADTLIGTLNEDNTQLLVLNFKQTIKTTDTWDITAESININNYRYKSTSTIGLRSTSWTNIYNNKMSYLYSGSTHYPYIGPQYIVATYKESDGSNTFVYKNIYSRWGDYYGAFNNSTITMDNSDTSQSTSYNPIDIASNAFQCHGIIQGGINDKFIIISNSIISNYNNGYIYYRGIHCGEVDKTNRVPINNFYINHNSDTKLIDDIYWRTLVVAQGYLYPSFIYMIDGILIFGMRKESYNSSYTSSYAENIICIGYKPIIDYSNLKVSFTYVGVCEGGTFRNSNLYNISLNNNDYAPYFDTYPERYDYDPFQCYTIEYDTTTSKYTIDF